MRCDLSKYLALQVFPESGRSRTRTSDLFLIRNTFCPLQSPQLALNPCKPPRRRQRKGTGGDWTGQPSGPLVAPRPPFEGMVSYDPEADITATIRSSPDAPEAARGVPAGWRAPRRASPLRRARPSRGRMSPGSARRPWPGCRATFSPAPATPPQPPRLLWYRNAGGAARKPAPPVSWWQPSC